MKDEVNRTSSSLITARYPSQSYSRLPLWYKNSFTFKFKLCTFIRTSPPPTQSTPSIVLLLSSPVILLEPIFPFPWVLRTDSPLTKEMPSSLQCTQIATPIKILFLTAKKIPRLLRARLHLLQPTTRLCSWVQGRSRSIRSDRFVTIRRMNQQKYWSESSMNWAAPHL